MKSKYYKSRRETIELLTMKIEIDEKNTLIWDHKWYMSFTVT